MFEAISYIKNVSRNSPTYEKFWTIYLGYHITSASNIDFSFVNGTIKQLLAKNKINDKFKIIEETENGNLNQSTDEAQTLLNEELNETLDGSPTTSQLVDEKELEIVIATIATFKRQNKKCGPKEAFKLVKGSLESCLTKENFNECLGQLVSNKSVKHNAVNQRRI